MAQERSYLVANATDAVVLQDRILALGWNVDRLPVLDANIPAAFRVKALGIGDVVDLTDDVLDDLNAWEEE